MGNFNQTVLRCAEAVFNINVTEMNKLKITTIKQTKEANRAMIMRNTQPIFSGNIQSYLINQLAEYELIAKVRNVMSKEDTNRVHLCAIHPYYQRMMAQANTQFADVASQINKEI